MEDVARKPDFSLAIYNVDGDLILIPCMSDPDSLAPAARSPTAPASSAGKGLNRIGRKIPNPFTLSRYPSNRQQLNPAAEAEQRYYAMLHERRGAA